MILDADHFETPALFHLLREKIIEVGRQERVRGVKIAQLALDSAMSFEKLDETFHSPLQAQAWAYLGNAQRLNFKLADAERCFDIAERLLPTGSEHKQILGQILYLKSALRWFQRKYYDGLDCACRAIPLLQEAEDYKSLATAILHRGILYRDSGDLNRGMDDFAWASLILEEFPNTELSFNVDYSLARGYWHKGDHQKAQEMLISLRQRSQGEPMKLFRLFVEWFDGRLCLDQRQLDGATQYLNRAYAGFFRIQPQMASLVGLDLAIVHFLQKRPDLAIKYAREAHRTLKVWRREKSFEESYSKLERISKTKIVTLEDLEEIRDASQELTIEPSSLSLMKLRGLA